MNSGEDEEEDVTQSCTEVVEKLVTRHEEVIYFYSEVTLVSVSLLLKHIRDAKQGGIREVFLHIHSYGGDAFAGLIAYHHIRNETVRVVTVVDGMAASAATFLLLAGEERMAHRFSFVLIHQLSGGMFGKYRDMVDEMNNTHNLMKVVARLYKERTSMTSKCIQGLLKTEVALSSVQCCKRGIVHSVIR